MTNKIEIVRYAKQAEAKDHQAGYVDECHRQIPYRASGYYKRVYDRSNCKESAEYIVNGYKYCGLHAFERIKELMDELEVPKDEDKRTA